MSDLLTAEEYAEREGISKQHAYRLFRTKLKGQVTVVDGIKRIPAAVAFESHNSINATEMLIASYEARIAELTEQVHIKDEHIAYLLELNRNTQVLSLNTQARLTAGKAKKKKHFWSRNKPDE